jgi:hypothetical protein
MIDWGVATRGGAGGADGGAAAEEAKAFANFSISAGAPWAAGGGGGAKGDGALPAGEESNGEVSNREDAEGDGLAGAADSNGDVSKREASAGGSEGAGGGAGTAA